MYKESKTRSVLKTISWRFWATITTVLLVFLFVGEVEIALSIGFFEVILKMLIYFLHERTWDKIKFGKEEIKPAVIWLTGLAKSGKKEIGTELQKMFIKKGMKAEFIDGHSVRNLMQDNGFEREHVNIHIERIGYLAKKLEEHGVFVIASFLSPYKKSRDFVKVICRNFHEVYVDTPLEVCEQRDETGVYKKAKTGEIKNLPGIDIHYEKPENPSVIVNVSEMNPKEAAWLIFKKVSETF